MLEHAKKMAREGRAVYVIADNSRDMTRLEILCGEPSLGIKFETPDSPGNFVWSEMRLQGAHPNCVVLVDHHAIEDHFARVLEMLHAYDAPSVNDTALLNWLEENNGRLQFEAEDEATTPHAVVYLPTLEDGESRWREAGRGVDFRAAITDAMGKDAPLTMDLCATPTELHHHWRVRKRYPDGMFGCCEYNSPLPVSANTVARAPSVQRWLDGCQIDEIYHPGPNDTAKEGGR